MFEYQCIWGGAWVREQTKANRKSEHTREPAKRYTINARWTWCTGTKDTFVCLSLNKVRALEICSAGCYTTIGEVQKPTKENSKLNSSKKMRKCFRAQTNARKLETPWQTVFFLFVYSRESMQLSMYYIRAQRDRERERELVALLRICIENYWDDHVFVNRCSSCRL